MNWQVIHGDCLEVMRGFAPGSFDAVITDPPFDDTPGIVSRLRAALGLLSSGGVAYILLDWRSVHHVAVALGDILPLVNEIIWKVGWVSGFRSHAKSAWVLNHNTILQFGHPAYFVMPQREPRTKERARYKTPTKPTAFDTVWDDCPSVRQTSFVVSKSGHPYEKPRKLMRRLIESSVRPRGKVLDPFCGSGTTGVASVELGRDFTGIEIDSNYAQIAHKRIEGARQVDV